MGGCGAHHHQGEAQLVQLGIDTLCQGTVHLEHDGRDAENVQIWDQLVQQGQVWHWLAQQRQIYLEKHQFAKPLQLSQQEAMWEQLLQLTEHLLVWHGDEGEMVLEGEDDAWEVEEEDVQEVDGCLSKLFQHGIQ